MTTELVKPTRTAIEPATTADSDSDSDSDASALRACDGWPLIGSRQETAACRCAQSCTLP